MKSIDLVRLAKLYAGHRGLALSTVATYAQRDGKFFARLENSGGCTLKVAARVLGWLSDNWPTDLEWPSDIPRPPRAKREAA